MQLQPYLQDLENRIDPQQEEALEQEWLAFAKGQCKTPFFSPSRPKSPPAISWPVMLVNDAFEGEQQMVYQQLRLVSQALAEGDGALLNARANYGTGIIPSMFGAEMFYLDAALDTLPCTRPLADGETGVRRILDQGKADFTKGLAAKVFRFAQAYRQATQGYPKISRYVHVYNPDLQGPFPLVDALWGGDIYVAFYDEEDLVRDALEFFTTVYLDFTRRWQAIFPPFSPECSVEWGLLHRGHTIIRNDAAMNVSGDMYLEFVAPHDQRLLRELGGGIHFCGRGDHYIQHVGSLENISCINLSQPHLNDMEKVYQHSIDKGLGIIGLPAQETERAMAAGRDLRGLVHSGASLAAWEQSKEKA